VRRALPPLYGKQVELVSVTRIIDGAFAVRLSIDGLAYEVRWFANDELTVMLRLMKMQAAKPRSAFDEADHN
jgi:hypothetical protein